MDIWLWLWTAIVYDCIFMEIVLFCGQTMEIIVQVTGMRLYADVFSYLLPLG